MTTNIVTSGLNLHLHSQDTIGQTWCKVQLDLQRDTEQKRWHVNISCRSSLEVLTAYQLLLPSPYKECLQMVVTRLHRHSIGKSHAQQEPFLVMHMSTVSKSSQEAYQVAKACAFQQVSIVHLQSSISHEIYQSSVIFFFNKLYCWLCSWLSSPQFFFFIIPTFSGQQC